MSVKPETQGIALVQSAEGWLFAMRKVAPKLTAYHRIVEVAGWSKDSNTIHTEILNIIYECENALENRQ